MEVSQHAEVKYLRCFLDEVFSDVSFALNVIDKVSSRLNFLHSENCYLTFF